MWQTKDFRTVTVSGRKILQVIQQVYYCDKTTFPQIRANHCLEIVESCHHEDLICSLLLSPYKYRVQCERQDEVRKKHDCTFRTLTFLSVMKEVNRETTLAYIPVAYPETQFDLSLSGHANEA
jgi:hypothetical protein